MPSTAGTLIEADAHIEPHGIRVGERVPVNIGVCIQSAKQPNRITGNEASRPRIVISIPVVEEAAFLSPILPRQPEINNSRGPVLVRIVNRLDTTKRQTPPIPNHGLISIGPEPRRAIANAEQRVYLTNAYFVPDLQLLKSLTDAARRGVDVRLVLPSYSDSWTVFHAGRSHYTKLLRAGVKIYERRGAVMHSKTASIDGVWSTVGSTHLDWRRFLHNDELNAAILSRDFARQMDALFAKDLTESDVIDLDRWEHRSMMLRLKEWLARLAEYWL